MSEPTTKAEVKSQAREDARKGKSLPPDIQEWNRAALHNYLAVYTREKRRYQTTNNS
jgi:hypothetical protein